MLIIFAGLPGTGKTTIAMALAHQLDAVYLRIDSIEQAMRDSGAIAGPLDDAGYRAAYAIAEDNLRLGRTVVEDSVNPLSITRDAWLCVAAKAHVCAIEVEIICSDVREHQRRVEMRASDIPGLKLPSWKDVISRGYYPWARKHVILDTARQTADECVRIVRESLASDFKAPSGLSALGQPPRPEWYGL